MRWRRPQKVFGHSCSTSTGSSGRLNFCSRQPGYCLTKCWLIAGYARLTSLNKSLLRQFFEGWSTAEKAEKLRLLAESGGFLGIELVVRLWWSSGGLLALGGLLYVLCSSLLYGFLPWSCTTNRNIFGFLHIFFLYKCCRKARAELSSSG